MKVIIQVLGGVVTAVHANGECDVTLVDWDDLHSQENEVGMIDPDKLPELPKGVEWGNDAIVVPEEETDDGELWSEVL